MGQQDGVTVHVLGVDAFDLRFGMNAGSKLEQSISSRLANFQPIKNVKTRKTSVF
jgi:hypothetical protein